MIKMDNLRIAAFWVVIATSLLAPLGHLVIASNWSTPSSSSSSSSPSGPSGPSGHGSPPFLIGDPVTDGAALYDSKCAFCHGKDGAGLPNWRSLGQPDFTKAEWQKSHTDEQIADSIKNGKGKFMPSFKSKLAEQETGAMVQRIRAFGKKQ
jgi:cytochrome c553